MRGFYYSAVKRQPTDEGGEVGRGHSVGDSPLHDSPPPLWKTLHIYIFNLLPS